MNSAESATFTANQLLQEAITWADRALKLAVQARRDQHWLALKEHRVIGLIDAVQHETRISEAILLLKGARNAPGLCAPAFGFAPAGCASDPVDNRPHESTAVDP